MDSRILKISIQKDDSMLKAMTKMDEQDVKLLLVWDGNRFSGLVSIGDIQRAILKKKTLNTPVKSILRTDITYAKLAESMDQIRNKMKKFRTEFMPVLNGNGELDSVYFWEDVFTVKEQINDRRLDIPVVIMAGGEGTRLKPLTNVIPKPLIPIEDKTILETIIDQFHNIGCQSFYLTVNYKYEILEYYLNNIDKTFNLEFLKEHKPLGTIGSVSLLKNKIDTPFFVSNCDIIVNQDYREVYDYHIDNHNEITIVSAIKNYKIPYGVIDTNEGGVLNNLSEKPDLSFQINTGVYILNPDLIDEIPENKFYHITHLINKVKERGGKIGCFPVSEGAWTDIGNWEEYLKLIL